MDYSNIKKIVINKRWPEGEGKYGDDYRSLSKQIDNFIEHIKKKDSPLQWLPLDIMTDEEVADIANTYLSRNSNNRLLLNNLNYKGIKYNYKDLIVKDLEVEKDTSTILEITPKLKEHRELRIIELISEINIVLVGAKYEGYMKTAKKLLEYIDLIRDEILNEKWLFEVMGLGYKNTNYIEQYISVCERICLGSLFFLLIENPNLPNKMEAMSKIEEKLNVVFDTIKNEIILDRKKFVESRKIHQEHYNISPNEAADISQYYVQFLERKAYYNELDNIQKVLEKEIQDTPKLYGKAISPLSEKTSNYKDKELKAYICEDINVSEYKKKLEETKRIIDFAFKNNNLWGSSEDSTTLKIVFREYFMSKKTYMRKSSMTLIRNILAGERVESRELMFLNMKIIRGVFREKNMLKEYYMFSRICSRVRKMFLLSYKAINDTEAYRLVHRSCFEFLYLFGDGKYSGILIE